MFQDIRVCFKREIIMRGMKMKKDDIYNAIFKRKSIRKYDLSPLDKNTLKEISKHIDDLQPLYKDIEVEIQIISTDDVNRRMMKKAPYYLAVFSEKKEGYLTNVGFMLQQMDLMFSAMGIGSCWQGIPIPNKEVLNSSDLKFIILMAFGKPSEPLYRKNISEFKRNPIEKITSIHDMDELLEPVRLAPSATNSQPWFFKGTKNIIKTYSIKPNFLKAIVVKKYIPIDMGIALYHLKVAAEQYGKEIKIFFDEKERNTSPKGYNYIATVGFE
jgi:nitroreductase